MFIAVAMTVAAFNIMKAKDDKGREIDPVHEFTAGVIRYDIDYIVYSLFLLLNSVSF